MNAKSLEHAGALLFGYHWRASFEDKFGISNRALRRILTGQNDVPEGLARDIEIALRDHANAVDEMLETMV